MFLVLKDLICLNEIFRFVCCVLVHFERLPHSVVDIVAHEFNTFDSVQCAFFSLFFSFQFRCPKTLKLTINWLWHTRWTHISRISFAFDLMLNEFLTIVRQRNVWMKEAIKLRKFKSDFMLKCAKYRWYRIKYSVTWPVSFVRFSFSLSFSSSLFGFWFLSVFPLCFQQFFNAHFSFIVFETEWKKR